VRGKYGAEMVNYSDYGFEMVGDLAESWSSSPDKTEWTFKLKSGAKWQNLPPLNGRDFVADDVVFSYNLYMKSPVWASLWSDVARVEAPDKSTVKIGLKEAVAYFPQIPLTNNYMMILPKEIADQDGDFKQRAIGTGAFMLKEWTRGTRAVMVKNPDYFRKGRPFLDGFEFQFVPDAAAQTGLYRASRVQYAYPAMYGMPRDLADGLVKTIPGTVVGEEIPSAVQWGMAVRLDKAPFNDVRARRAMSLALNRPGMVQALGGTGLILPSTHIQEFFDGPPSTEDAFKNWPWLRYDPEQAKQLLAQAGYPNGFSATADFFPQRQSLQTMVQLAQQDLKKVGINVELKTWDAAGWNGPNGPGTGGYQEMTMFSAAGFGSGVEMDEYTRQVMHSKSTLNLHRINDPQIDQWTEAERKELDPAKRKAIVKQILDHANDQLFGIPFIDEKRIFATSPRFKFFLTNWVNQWPHWGGQMWEDLWLGDK
jgi:peptide/nickel transport system substrate-binding protein